MVILQKNILKYWTRIYLKLNKILRLLRIIGLSTASSKLLTELSVNCVNNDLYKSKKPLIKLLFIDIVVVSGNGSQWIEKFFAHLTSQTYPLIRINLYIVDNCSARSSADIFKKLLAKFGNCFNSTTLINQPNLDYGASCDAAIKLGNAKYIFITNIEVMLSPGSLLEIVTLAESSVAHVASWELRQQPFECLKYYDPVTLQTAWSSYAAVLVSRKAYEQVGGFEQKFLTWAQDVELSYRFRSYGYILKYCPTALAWHYRANITNSLEYTSSILANTYLRLRYGSLTDIMAIFVIYALLLVTPSKFAGVKKLLIKNCCKTIKHAKYFLKSRRHTKGIAFQFELIDYTIKREGADIKTTQITARPLVSIIMRVTGKRSFAKLRQSILTVSNQVYKNLELIIVEDGGRTHQASCKKLCQDLSLTYQYYPLPKVGRAKAGNHGLAVSAGTYLMFLDDDDYLFADHIETIIAHILHSQEYYAAGYALSWEAKIARDSQLFTCHNLYTPPNLKQDYDFALLKTANFIPSQAIIFNRELFIERGGFDPALEYLEDWNLWYRYGYNNKFKFVPKTTSIYTVTSDIGQFIKRHKKFKAAFKAAHAKAQTAIKNYF